MRTVLVLILFAMALAVGATAVAQEYEAPPPAETQMEVSDQQLKKFVKAQSEIDIIRQDYSTRLTETQDSQIAQELQSEANMEMTQAVEAAGLDVESFNRIAIAVQQDPELRDRLAEIID